MITFDGDTVWEGQQQSRGGGNVIIRRGVHGGDPKKAEEEMEKKLKEHEAEAAKPPDVEYQIRFAEYKEVGGVTLPDRISKGIESEASEEIEFTKFKINPQIKLEKFVKK